MKRRGRVAAAAAAFALGLAADDAAAALNQDHLVDDASSSSGHESSRPGDDSARPAAASSKAVVAQRDLPPFDATEVKLAQKVRFELHAGLWLVEQAGRLRTTNPSLGLGLSGMLAPRIRWDVGYLATAGRVGTPDFNVLNVYQALRARGHYGWAFGGAHLFAGAGPLITLVTSSHSINGVTTDGALKFEPGAEMAVGLQTEVWGRALRFEVAAASRAFRVDGRAGVAVGF